MILTKKDFLLLGERVGAFVKTVLLYNLKIAGHSLTNVLMDSILFHVEQEEQGIKVIFEMQDYGLILDKGTSPQRIPYTITKRGQGRGGTSKYIQGLILYARRRFGLDEKAAINAAFAIAKKQKRTGMRGSGWVTKSILEVEKELPKLIEEIVPKAIEAFFVEFNKFSKVP
jgi:hypothetical protein